MITKWEPRRKFGHLCSDDGSMHTDELDIRDVIHSFAIVDFGEQVAECRRRARLQGACMVVLAMT